MNPETNANARSGVSLIIVLGLLVVLAVLALAFSRSMREGRLTSRSYADQVRAESLAQAALVRAMNDVDASMQGVTYPYWNPADAMASSNGAFCSDLLSGEATNFIPRALWADAWNASQLCHWTNIVSDDGSRTYGRIAYLVVNCSGLVDANVAGNGGAPDADLDLSVLPDIADMNRFFSDRTNQIRYETIQELAALNTGISAPVSNLFIYSYDPDRDVYYQTNQETELGMRTIGLTNKCFINDTSTNWDRITNLLAEAGVSDPRTAGRYLVNYIDPDCIPQTDSAAPWLDPGGTEPAPLINEICLTLTNAASTSYCFQVELFYPFVTRQPVETAGMVLQMAVSPANAPSFTNTAIITHMDFSTQRFLVRTSAVFQVFDNSRSNVVSVSATNPVGFLASVMLTNSIVDQAPGSNSFAFNNPFSISVDDPRCNGSPSNWIQNASTLGAMNTNCNPWTLAGQGLPIFFANGPMQGIGEIGHIFTGVPWETIDLLSTNGGWLIDTMTVRTNAGSTQGLVNINTRQKDVLKALFANATIGFTNTDCSTNRVLTDTELSQLVTAFPDSSTTVMDSFADYLCLMGQSGWEPVVDVHFTKELKEDVFRNTPDLITFRQNLFTIIVAAQAFGPNGQTVVAEKRAVAIVYRDSYTGKHFIRFQKWISR